MYAPHRFDSRCARRAALALLLCAVLPSACNTPSRDAGALTSAGVTHLQMHEYDRAIRDFDRALALQPDLVVAWKHRGIAHRGKGDYERAVADYDQATLFAPNDARLLTDRGATYVLLNDYPRALKDFDRAIALKPDLAPAIEQRGRAHFYLGNFAQSAADLQRGLSLDSADAYAAILLHLIRQRLKQDDAADFAAHSMPADSAQWPAPITRYFLGQLSADSLQKVASVTDSEGQAQGCVVAFYLGEDALLRGDPSRAAKLFEVTRSQCPRDLAEYKGAVAELRRLAR